MSGTRKHPLIRMFTALQELLAACMQAPRHASMSQSQGKRKESYQKLRKGAMPVPAATMMMGACGCSGMRNAGVGITCVWVGGVFFMHRPACNHC